MYIVFKKEVCIVVLFFCFCKFNKVKFFNLVYMSIVVGRNINVFNFYDVYNFVF